MAENNTTSTGEKEKATMNQNELNEKWKSYRGTGRIATVNSVEVALRKGLPDDNFEYAVVALSNPRAGTKIHVLHEFEAGNLMLAEIIFESFVAGMQSRIPRGFRPKKACRL